MAADQLIAAEWVIPVEPEGQVLTDHSVALAGSHIVDILPTADARARYPDVAESRSLPGHVLMPGLINAHTHAAMSLFRGYADDLELMDWLGNHIWPAEGRWVDEAFVRAGTRLAIAEMLQSGTTCFQDMYFFPGVTASEAQAMGIRCCVGMIMIDFPSRYAGSADEYLEKGLAVHDAMRHSPLVTTAFAPHAPYTVSDEPLAKIATLAEELDVQIHMHVHETAHEVDESSARFGKRPLERLGDLGLLGTRLQAVHMTQLLGGEVESIAEIGVSVLHCPESNLKLASGITPVADLLDAGVNIGLGTDGAASNNDLDMFSEMRTAALLAKGGSGRPTALPARAALSMATIAGARAMAIDEQTGSLVPGKQADMIAVDLSGVSSQPVYDPISQIVYSTSRDQVKQVWVAGRRLIADAVPTAYDPRDILQEARNWGARMAAAHNDEDSNP